MKKEVHVLAVVITPLQLINATEYLSGCGAVSSKLIVLNNSARWSKGFLEKRYILDKWSEVILFNQKGSQFTKPKSRVLKKTLEFIEDFRFKRFWIRILNEVERCDFFIIGNSRDQWMRHAANSLEYKYLIECDDGVRVLIEDFSPGILWSIKRKIFRFNCRAPEIDILFTAFRVEEYNKARIVTNDYDHIRGLLKQIEEKKSNEVWFIGQPLVEIGLMNIEKYTLLISSILNGYSREIKFRYASHPVEDLKKVERLCELLSMNKHVSSGSLEVDMLSEAQTPRGLILLYSSAGVTIKKIFGENVNVTAYQPNLDLFTKKMNGKTYNDVYSGLKKILDVKEINVH